MLETHSPLGWAILSHIHSSHTHYCILIFTSTKHISCRGLKMRQCDSLHKYPYRGDSQLGCEQIIKKEVFPLSEFIIDAFFSMLP